MEDALRDINQTFTMATKKVLILVLMEDALRVTLTWLRTQRMVSLNPCSNGRCSASAEYNAYETDVFPVLILVLMEDALRDFQPCKFVQDV